LFQPTTNDRRQQSHYYRYSWPVGTGSQSVHATRGGVLSAGGGGVWWVGGGGRLGGAKRFGRSRCGGPGAPSFRSSQRRGGGRWCEGEKEEGARHPLACAGPQRSRVKGLRDITYSRPRTTGRLILGRGGGCEGRAWMIVFEHISPRSQTRRVPGEEAETVG